MDAHISAADLEEFLQLKSKTTILGALDEDQIISLLNQMDVSRHEHGATIFSKGEPASAIYVLLRGVVRLDFGDDGHPLSQIEFEPGDCFGETSVIGIQPHSAGAVAHGDVTLLALSSATLHSLYETDTKLFAMLLLNVAREASRRLHHTDSLFLAYTKTRALQPVQ